MLRTTSTDQIWCCLPLSFRKWVEFLVIEYYGLTCDRIIVWSFVFLFVPLIISGSVYLVKPEQMGYYETLF
ncbi:unnamed protein product [Trifolium pratense]|uniref:Uncharacterized protein n=1 Tax=Trifolium pratense TaxID=57577 RepID=A0ACB0K634_TRIPR|nr:unnamed protein product [Trifolium pratense]